MKRWSKRFFSTTSGRIIQRLSTGAASVGDLAAELDVTPNAIRASLAKLEAEGFVRSAGKRAAVRKPEGLYALTGDAEQLFPRAYHVLLNRLIDVLHARLPAPDVEKMLQEVGKMVAAAHAAPDDPSAGDRAPLSEDRHSEASTDDRRVRHAARVLRELGGLPEVRPAHGGWVIEGRRCPLESAVREHPEVCRLAQAMLAEIIGRPVAERCSRNGEVRCRFEVPGDAHRDPGRAV